MGDEGLFTSFQMLILNTCRTVEIIPMWCLPMTRLPQSVNNVWQEKGKGKKIKGIWILAIIFIHQNRYCLKSIWISINHFFKKKLHMSVPTSFKIMWLKTMRSHMLLFRWNCYILLASHRMVRISEAFLKNICSLKSLSEKNICIWL